MRGFVALEVGGGDQKQVLQRSTECVFVCLIVALCGNADDFNFNLADLLSRKLVDRNQKATYGAISKA